MKPFLPLVLLLCSLLLLLWGAPTEKHIAFFALLWGFLLLYQLADLASAEALQTGAASHHARLAAMILNHLDAEKIRRQFGPALGLLGSQLLVWALGGCAYLAWVYTQQHDLSQVIDAALPGAILLCFMLQTAADEDRNLALYVCGVLFVFCCVLNIDFAGAGAAHFDPAAAALLLYPLYFPLRRCLRPPLQADVFFALMVIVGALAAAFFASPGPQNLALWCAGAAIAGRLWARAQQGPERRYRIFMR